MLLEKKKSKYRRLEQSLSPPLQPSKRSILKQKKVTYANENEVGGSNMRALKDPCISSNSEYIVNEYDDEHGLYSTSIPRLSSVKELAAMLQPKPSPEPKPRKSLTKKKCFDQRITEGNRIVPSHHQTHVSTNNTFAQSNKKLQERRVCKTTDTIEEKVDDDQDIPTPLAAKLKADGVSVSFQVPSQEHFSNNNSLKKAYTSSATLPTLSLGIFTINKECFMQHSSLTDVSMVMR